MARPAQRHAFPAACPACRRDTVFLAYKADRPVAAVGASEEERTARTGFRCGECRRVQAELRDAAGVLHRWDAGTHVVE